MERLTEIISGQWTGTVVWAFIHSLWQGVIIALLFKSYLNRTKSDPHKRYAAGLAAMFALLVCLVITASVINNSETSSPFGSAFTGFDEKQQESSNRQSLSAGTVSAANSPDASESNISATLPADHSYGANNSSVISSVEWKQILFFCWLVGVLVMTCRIVILLAGTTSLRRTSRPLCQGKVYEIFCELKQKMSVKQNVILAVSDRILAPGIIGMIKPVILLPVSMATGLSAEDICSILCHELAHIKRCDWLVNIFQLIIEAVLFFNPAVWWISSQVRLEREAACDNVSVEVTGEKQRYAKILFECGKAYADRKPFALAAITGFAGQEKTSSVADRIKRLLLPGYKPAIRFSLLSVLGAVLISIVLIVGLWKGADHTVKYIGKLLTPQQRIEKMDELRKDFTPTEEEMRKVKVSGTVTTVDGRDIGKWELNARAYQWVVRVAGGSGNGKSQQFSSKLSPGRNLLGGFMEGYAPYVKELEVKTGQDIPDLKIVFDHGFDAKIQLVDEQGKPVQNAKVKTGLHFGNITTGEGLQGTSGPDGIAILGNAVEHPMSITILADGFQKIESRSYKPQRDKVRKYIMKKARPASGVVVSAKTGKPLEGARLRICSKKSSSHQHGYGFSDKIAAVTGPDGRFVLDFLQDDAVYDIVVGSQGYGYKNLLGLKAGDKDIKVELGPPVKIKGKIVGDLEKLGKTRMKIDGQWKKVYEIRATCRADVLNASKYLEGGVEVVDGVGYFEFENVFGDAVRFKSGNLNNLYKLQISEVQSEYNILIDLDPDPGTDMSGREVVIKFIQPGKMPKPKGKVYVAWITEPSRQHHYETVEVKDGIGKLKVQPPCEIQCTMRRWPDTRLKGYWFDRVLGVSVDDSDSVFELEVPVQQAGSIYGKILNQDGSTGYGYNTLIHVVKKPEDIDAGFINESIDNNASVSTGMYYASPVPFGGKYVITARKGNYIMAGKTIKLTSSKPIAEYDFVRGPSIDISGKIVNFDGTPMANVSFSVYAETDIAGEKCTWGSRPETTDEKGQFVIKDINPDSDTDYYIRVPSQNDRLKIRSIKKFNTLKLSRTKVVTGSVVDEDTGKGIGGVPVTISLEVDSKIYPCNQAATDSKGIFKLTVPQNAKVRANVSWFVIRSRYSSYNQSRNSLDFQLRPVNRLKGKLVDADTGKPIAGVKINGYAFDRSHKVYNSNLRPMTNAGGEFTVSAIGPDNYQVIDIDGYELVGQTKVSFGKGDRKKEIIIKARKVSE